MNDVRRTSRLRRWFFHGTWMTLALGAAAVAALAWLVATAPGARFVLERGAAVLGARLGAVEGTLLGPLAIDSIEFVSPALRLRAGKVSLDWAASGLLGGEIRIARLHAQFLEIETAPSPQVVRQPVLPVIPVRLHVAQAGVDRLRVGTIGDGGEAVELRDLSLKLAADQAAWILGGAEAVTPVGRAKIAGTLGAHAPFPLDLKGELSGSRNGAVYGASVVARGPLARFEARLSGSGGGLAGKGNATVEPYATVPVRRLALQLEGLDLAAFTAAPHTRLAVQADLAPEGDALLAGPVKITNLDAGPIDKGRLPVALASARLDIREGRVAAGDLALEFASGGTAKGRAAWAGGKLEAFLAVADVNLVAWHSALRGTRLAGEVKATATQSSQAFGVTLADPRFEIAGEARIESGRLTVDHVRLARAAAFAEASGSLVLAGAREFAVKGRVQGVDPAAFAKVPAGDLNATFEASGNLAGGIVGKATVDIARSQFAGLAMEGRFEAALDAARALRADAALSVGATRLVAKGALGRPGDTIRARLSSPDLAPIGRALGLAIGGRLDVDARLGGSWAEPSGTATVDVRNLVLPGSLRATALTGRFALGEGRSGAADARLELTGLSRGESRAVVLERADLSLKGVRESHEIRLEARFPDRNSLRVLLAGGLAGGASGPEWRGRLESFESGGSLAVALVAPAPLFLSADRIEASSVAIAGEPGEARIALLRWTPSGIEARGSSRGLLVRPFMGMVDVSGVRTGNLSLAAEWDVKVAESVDGTVSIRRERGDIRLGEPPEPLGLEALDLRVEARAGRVNAVANMRGKQIGRWNAEAAATIRRGGEGWEVSPLAPLEGRFALDVPDLSWLAEWLGPGARAGGRLSGEGSLAGTLREPAWRGRVAMDGVSFREPISGAEVAEGSIALALADREARIERFTLSMPWRPSQEAARAIGEVPHPEPGTLTAQGAIDLATRKGAIRVKASAFPVTRLPSRFLALSGEGSAQIDGATIAMTGDFTADAGWFGIPATPPPSLSDDVIVERGPAAAEAGKPGERIRLDLRLNTGEHLHFSGRGLVTRLAGGVRLTGDVGANLRAAGSIRAVSGTFDAYGRALAIERGALNFQGPLDNPGLNVLALRKGLPVEAGVEVLGTVNHPKVRLFSSPDVPDGEKLAWLVLGRGRGDVSAADAATLLTAAGSALGREAMPARKLLGGLGLANVSIGHDEGGVLGTLPESTVAGKTGTANTADVVRVGVNLTDDIRASYQQGLAEAEGSLRIVWQVSKSLQLILRAGYEPGVDAAYRFSFD